MRFAMSSNALGLRSFQTFTGEPPLLRARDGSSSPFDAPPFGDSKRPVGFLMPRRPVVSLVREGAVDANSEGFRARLRPLGGFGPTAVALGIQCKGAWFDVESELCVSASRIPRRMSSERWLQTGAGYLTTPKRRCQRRRVWRHDDKGTRFKVRKIAILDRC